jgi:hypothetical protein
MVWRPTEIHAVSAPEGFSVIDRLRWSSSAFRKWTGRSSRVSRTYPTDVIATKRANPNTAQKMRAKTDRLYAIDRIAGSDMGYTSKSFACWAFRQKRLFRVLAGPARPLSIHKLKRSFIRVCFTRAFRGQARAKRDSPKSSMKFVPDGIT